MNKAQKQCFEVLEKRGCPVAALCYDFDKTMSPKDMQEYGFIERLSMSAEEFWRASNELVKSADMDSILAYMFTMTKEAKRKGIIITEKDLRELGKDIELFKGVEDWFYRINAFGINNQTVIEHYIISSGIKEIIEGNPIAQWFTKIYASSFYYDDSGRAVWPRQAVNFTTKTQYLFRINKNCEIEDVNRYMPDEKRRIPFSHFIYIGDSETDIPCMRLIKSSGGNSIGVYNPADDKGKKTVSNLIKENRINYYAPADYSEGGMMEMIVKKIIAQIKAKHELQRISAQQYANALRN